MGWNLPPGVTARMIDEAMGADTCTCEQLVVEQMHLEGIVREVAEGIIEHAPCEYCVACREAEENEGRAEDAAWARYYSRRED